MKIRNALMTFICLCALPIYAQEYKLDDFENGKLNFAATGGEMGNFAYEVVGNPSKKGINTSDYVLKFKRTVDNTPDWAGYWFDVKEELRECIKPQTYRYAHVKYYRLDNQSSMKMKIEQSSAAGPSLEVGSSFIPAKVGEWEELVFDFNGGVGPYSRLVIMPDVVANRPAGIEVYVDDIRFSNDPNPLMVFTEARPINLVYENLSSSEVTLRWAAMGGAVSYSVYNDGKEIKTTSDPLVSLANLTPDTEYRISVKGNNADGHQSLSSEPVIFKTLSVGKLGAVTGLVSMDKVKIPASDSNHPAGWKYQENKYQDKICLEWNPVFRAVNYEIYKDGVKIADTSVTNYDVTGLTPHTIYNFQVKAIGEGEESEITPKLYVQTEETAEQRDERMKWWREARFGMMITWGVHSAYAGEYNGQRADKHNGEGQYSEWIMFGQNIPVEEYKAKAVDFTCENYDPDAWMQAAADAGMKYLVFISKHHDGFALWDSKASPWNAAKASGAKRDVMKPLIDAARKRGLKIGIYYSHSLDWCNEGGLGWMPQLNKPPYNGVWDKEHQDRYVRETCLPQIKELMTEFGKVDVFWWDMGVADLPLEYEQMMLGVIYESGQGEHIIFNNRLRFDDSTPGDHDTPEQSIPGVPATGYADGHDWETCMTMNDNWGYSKHDDEWKTPGDVIHKLVDITSKGGNFLLNVGPKADGAFPAPSSHILSELHKYMEVNAEAIHGTGACPLKNGVSYGRITQKKEGAQTTLYIHVFDWPADGKLLVKGLYNEHPVATLLKDNSKLNFTVSDEGLLIQVPAEMPTPYSATIKLILNEPLDVREVPVVQAADGKLVLSAATALLADDSGICREQKENIASLGCWQGVPDSGESVQWYAKLTQPGTFLVKGEVAAFESGKFKLVAGENQSQIAFTGTGGWDAGNFKTLDMGTIQIDQSGLFYISLTPLADGWHPLGLRGITLERKGGTGITSSVSESVMISVRDKKICCEVENTFGDPVLLSLYNMQGSLLESQKSSLNNSGKKMLSLNCNENGLYIVKVHSPEHTYVQKISVQ